MPLLVKTREHFVPNKRLRALCNSCANVDLTSMHADSSGLTGIQQAAAAQHASTWSTVHTLAF